MRNVLVSLLISSLAAACAPAPAMVGDDDDMTPDAGNPPPGDIIDITADVSADATWSGTVNLLASVAILPGVTITMAPGTTLVAAAETALTVRGILVAEGTDASGIIMGSDGSGDWNGLVVASGGAAQLAFVEVGGASIGITCETGAAQCDVSDAHFHDNLYAGKFQATASVSRSLLETDGAFFIEAGADLTITDTILTGVSGDLLVQSGGRLTIQYSQVSTAMSTEHCGFHINSADSLIVDHNDLTASVYAFMLGGTTGGVITHNNFVGNMVDIDDMGGTLLMDATNNYWDNGAPTIPNYDTSNPSLTPFTDVGPR